MNKTIQSSSHTIVSGFLSSKNNVPVDVQLFWKFRHDLYIIGGVVLIKHHTVIPSSLCPEVLQFLHSTHQGVKSMNERAKVEVYWQDITPDILNLQDSCFESHPQKHACYRLKWIVYNITKVDFHILCPSWSDGRPEFVAQSKQFFFLRWCIRHRTSSNYLSSSNGRLEVEVKTAKRLLMNNISSNDTDNMVRTLLTLRSTPDPISS